MFFLSLLVFSLNSCSLNKKKDLGIDPEAYKSPQAAIELVKELNRLASDAEDKRRLVLVTEELAKAHPDESYIQEDHFYALLLNEELERACKVAMEIIAKPHGDEQIDRFAREQQCHVPNREFTRMEGGAQELIDEL